MKISFKTKLNVCQFYIGVCCFNCNFIFKYRDFWFLFIFFFKLKKKKKRGKEGKRKEYIPE